MNVLYLFSSPEGDIVLSPEDLQRPFLLTPQKAHPTLTLGDYFDTLKHFIFARDGEILQRIMNHRDSDPIGNIQIRGEKHGALYHLASVTVTTGTERSKFTISTALSEKAQKWLVREHDLLNDLGRTHSSSYLPKPYGLKKMNRQTANQTTEAMTLLAAQWFEDYHEWHLSVDPADGRQKVHIWDLKRGPRYATNAEARALFKAAAKILTLYYDFKGFRQISAWHHAAGDFIVHGDRSNEVKLTTVRRYEPLMETLTPEYANPVTALVFFFFHTTLQMRLDRREGVGETLWAEDFAVKATLEGFFKALQMREQNTPKDLPVSPKDLGSLLQSLSPEELEKIMASLVDHYETSNKDDLATIKVHIIAHVQVLHQALQDFHEPGPRRMFE